MSMLFFGQSRGLVWAFVLGGLRFVLIDSVGLCALKPPLSSFTISLVLSIV